ncbi:MAG: glycosyltransferase family 2 protein [Nevskiales bacterium]
MQPLSPQPLVSIIVPSFNQGRFIARTLDSILGQSYRPLEVVVVDGASRDDTVAVLKDYAARFPELRWQSEPDKGVADAVNKGLALARGEVLAIQSSDDIYYADAVAKAVAALRDHPECGMAYGDSDNIDVEDRLLSRYRVPEFSWEAFFGMALCLPQSSIFFRAELARQIGGWNAKYFACDIDYWLRLLLRAPAVKLPGVLSAWRVYLEQRTQHRNKQKIWDGHWQMIEDCAELKQASPRLQRLARASRHALALRYHPSGDLMQIRWHALCAFVLHPGFWRYWRLQELKKLLPGFGLARNVWRRLRPYQPPAPGPRIVPGGPAPISP